MYEFFGSSKVFGGPLFSLSARAYELIFIVLALLPNFFTFSLPLGLFKGSSRGRGDVSC